MIHLSASVRAAALVGLVGAATAGSANRAAAQCDTCATPVVAYQPVAAVPAVTYTPYTGWYPGKWLDNMRMRRWGVGTTTTAYTAAYAAPATYSAYTAAYVPYTAAYAPYVSAYAPLQRPVVQTSYLPVAAATGCDSCATASYAPVTAAYAPSTVLLRPVVAMQPVVADTGCSACASAGSPCGDAGCSACASSVYDSSVSPATYGAPTSNCAGCASQISSDVIYSTPSQDYGVPAAGSTDPVTPIPDLNAPPAGDARYPVQRAPSTDSGNGAIDPAPAADDANDSNTNFDAPRLLNPNGDRTASRPSVAVWNAVYRGPAKANRVGYAPNGDDARPAARQLTQAEIDARGWRAVPSGR